MIIPGNPLNIHLYGYPYEQKKEIENNVKELLNARFIQPNVNPSLAPVPLVKKADTSWRLYAQGNKQCHRQRQVPTKLDELYGAKILHQVGPLIMIAPNENEQR